ncbi:MAG: SEC-C domain-containing protein [Oscillospiraceae bacterium]|nr:SEC-C domain-containing protein [Oscillospiraceae bacterium]
MSKTESDDISWPEEYGRRKLNALYREIPLKDTTSRLLRKYFNAAANLYGIIPLNELYEIITSQNRSLVTRSEFLAFAKIARHECEGYHILSQSDLYLNGPATPFMDYEVVDISLIDDDLRTYHETLRGQQGKPYYVPEKKTFLAYADFSYWEPTPEATALREFLLTRISPEEELLNIVFQNIYYNVRCLNADLGQIIDLLDRIGVKFKSTHEIHTFAKIYTAFCNNARLQCNRGYTPNELSAMTAPEDRVPMSISLGPNIRRAIADGTMDADALRQDLLTMDMPNEALRFSLLKELADASKAAAPKAKKVGRNELCPCGSGKKYKHCCGR